MDLRVFWTDTARIQLEEIFDYFFKSPAIKFIFFSSVKVVADSVKGECLTEEAEPNPGTANLFVR